MTRLALAALLAVQAGGVAPKYGAEQSEKDKVSLETSMGLKIEGSGALVNYIRTLHPFLSMEKMAIRADGTQQVTAKNRRRIEYDEARIELRYDDEDYELDFKRGEAPPAGLDKNKLLGFLYMFAAGGRGFTLTPEGEYRSDDPNQDHNGEAMDLYTLGITRMPGREVREGEVYEKEWKGERAEKKDNKPKKGRFAFKQKVKVEKIEVKDGRKIATLAGELTGTLEVPAEEKDPGAKEQWTKCEGKTKLRIEVGSGRVLASEGSGKVSAYYKGTAEDGSDNELRLTFAVEGKLSSR
jgi:hypothetical protein